MQKTEILNLENRRLIYNFILDNPGLHLREIARRLKMKYFNLNYHINYLKKLGLVSIKSDDSYSRIYPKEKIGSRHKQLLNVIRKKTPRHILIFMCTYVVTSQKELSKQLDKHPTSVMVHLKKLLDLGIIEPAETKNGMALTNHPSGRNVLRTPKTRETLYRIKDYKLIKKLFLTYRKSLVNDEVFKEALEYVEYASKETKKYRKKKIKGKHIKTFDWYLDKMLEEVNEMLPFPFL